MWVFDGASIDEGLLRDFAQLARFVFLKQSGLISSDDELQGFFDASQPLLEILGQTRDFGESVATIVFQKCLQLATDGAGFRFLADVVETLAQKLKLQWV